MKFFVPGRPRSENKVLNPKQIASVCHEANRQLTKIIGDVQVQPHWEEAPEEMIRSGVQGVVWRLNNPQAPASVQHDEWMRAKLEDGWVWGEKKDLEKKTHPALVAYDLLPEAVKAKDRLFTAVVLSLAD